MAGMGRVQSLPQQIGQTLQNGGDGVGLVEQQATGANGFALLEPVLGFGKRGGVRGQTVEGLPGGQALGEQVAGFLPGGDAGFEIVRHGAERRQTVVAHAGGDVLDIREVRPGRGGRFAAGLFRQALQRKEEVRSL
jgi:hypothetical protein